MAQYSNGSTFDNTTGDPFMIDIPPYQQFETGYTITTPVNSKTVVHQLRQPRCAEERRRVREDRWHRRSTAEFKPIGSSEFEGAQVEIQPGSHVISGNGQPFGAFSYGFSEYNGYGYPGGLSLAPVATVTHVKLTPLTETATVNTQQCVTATVTDQNEEPVPGVRVDFVVKGANSAEEPVFAESSGKAIFCYAGAHTGRRHDHRIGRIGERQC